LIPLKNESIEVIRGYRPQAHLGPTIIGTRKGDLAYVRPPEDSLTRWTEPAKPRWLIFPRWMAEAPLTLQQVPKSQAFFMVATNAFNFEVLDQTAFQVVTEMVAACDTYSLVYSNLDEAISAIDELTRFADE
jgi:HprK-related kinase A